MNWRALPPEEKRRRRWARIPLNVAESMAFEGEPVNIAMLQAEHDQRTPLATSKPRSAS